MANLKVSINEQVSVSGKRVNNTKTTNIPGINNIYQERIKLNNRPSSYMYLYMEEANANNLHGKTVYLEAATDRTFTFTGDGTGGSTTVTMDAVLHPSVTNTTTTVGLAPSMRLSGDIIPTGETNTDGADNRVTSVNVLDNAEFDIAANTVSGSDQYVSVFGNERTIEGSVLVSGEKYITHTHPDSDEIKLGMRVTGTSVGADAYITKIVSNVEFEVSVASTGTGNDVYLTDSIKIVFDNEANQVDSTIHAAGVKDQSTKKGYLGSLKKSLDLWVAAGAPFSIGGVADVAFPYLKITHSSPGDSVVAREVYGSAYKGGHIYASSRTNALIANKTDTFTNEAVAPIKLLSLIDTVSSTSSQARSGGSASFSNDDLKYIRITNAGNVSALIYTHVGDSDLKAWARRDTRTAAIETSANLQERYGTDQYIVNKLERGQSLVYNNASIDLISNNGHAPAFTEFDTIYGVSESAIADAEIEIMVASK